MEKPKYKPEHLLMHSIGFTEEDLEANREGYMSKRQRALLDSDRDIWNTIIVAVAISALPLALLCAILSRPEITIKIESFVFVLLAAAVVVFVARRRWRRFNDDLRKGEVAAIEGRVRLDIANDGRTSTYTVAIESTIFPIKKQAFLAFKNGDPYRIYYAPHSKTILSAEWLRDEG